jgi:peptidyl-prolyl cis-trans isomerase C
MKTLMIQLNLNKFPIFFMHCSFICAFYSMAFFFLGCGLIEQEDNNVVIVLGSRHITTDELKKDLEFISAEMDLREKQQGQIRNQLAEQVINHYLVIEYAKEKNIIIADSELQCALDDIKRGYTESTFREALLREYVDFDQWKKRFKEQLLINKILKDIVKNIAPPSHKEIEQYFAENRDEFRYPKMVKFRQIVSSSKEEADNLLKRIQKGEEMSELARKYSIAPEAESGGEISWVAQEHLDESMGNIVFSLAPGELSPVVETPYGYHIFEVLSVRPEIVKELPEVIQEIESKLLHQKREIFLGKWLEDLRTCFEVKVNYELLAQLDLY